MTAKRFVFLEITHREVEALLRQMQWIMTGTEPRQPVHLTVRGPYRHAVPRDVLEKHRKMLRNDTLQIGEVGRFTNPDQEVVFLRVDSPNLRKVWWKPSYPIKDHGYTPHISLYRGSDAEFADRVAGFLRREQIELTCNEHRLTVHLGDGLRFGTDRPSMVDETNWPSNAEGITPTLLPRLRQFVNAYRIPRAPVAAANTAGSEGLSSSYPAGH